GSELVCVYRHWRLRLQDILCGGYYQTETGDGITAGLEHAGADTFWRRASVFNGGARSLLPFVFLPVVSFVFANTGTSIKERDDISLSQSTIALSGYAQSLQMVMTKVVPALTEVVRKDSATDLAGAEDDDF
ncbi:unnamed protein product, partial [Brassica napus]